MFVNHNPFTSNHWSLITTHEPLVIHLWSWIVIPELSMISQSLLVYHCHQTLYNHQSLVINTESSINIHCPAVAWYKNGTSTFSICQSSTINPMADLPMSVYRRVTIKTLQTLFYSTCGNLKKKPSPPFLTNRKIATKPQNWWSKC